MQHQKITSTSLISIIVSGCNNAHGAHGIGRVVVAFHPEICKSSSTLAGSIKHDANACNNDNLFVYKTKNKLYQRSEIVRRKKSERWCLNQ